MCQEVKESDKDIEAHSPVIYDAICCIPFFCMSSSGKRTARVAKESKIYAEFDVEMYDHANLAV